MQSSISVCSSLLSFVRVAVMRTEDETMMNERERVERTMIRGRHGGQSGILAWIVGFYVFEVLVFCDDCL